MSGGSGSVIDDDAIVRAFHKSVVQSRGKERVLDLEKLIRCVQIEYGHGDSDDEDEYDGVGLGHDEQRRGLGSGTPMSRKIIRIPNLSHKKGEKFKFKNVQANYANNDIVLVVRGNKQWQIHLCCAATLEVMSTTTLNTSRWKEVNVCFMSSGVLLYYYEEAEDHSPRCGWNFHYLPRGGSTLGGFEMPGLVLPLNYCQPDNDTFCGFSDKNPDWQLVNVGQPGMTDQLCLFCYVPKKETVRFPKKTEGPVKNHVTCIRIPELHQTKTSAFCPSIHFESGMSGACLAYQCTEDLFVITISGSSRSTIQVHNYKHGPPIRILESDPGSATKYIARFLSNQTLLAFVKNDQEFLPTALKIYPNVGKPSKPDGYIVTGLRPYGKLLELQVCPESELVMAWYAEAPSLESVQMYILLSWQKECIDEYRVIEMPKDLPPEPQHCFVGSRSLNYDPRKNLVTATYNLLTLSFIWMFMPTKLQAWGYFGPEKKMIKSRPTCLTFLTFNRVKFSHMGIITSLPWFPLAPFEGSDLLVASLPGFSDKIPLNSGPRGKSTGSKISLTEPRGKQQSDMLQDMEAHAMYRFVKTAAVFAPSRLPDELDERYKVRVNAVCELDRVDHVYEEKQLERKRKKKKERPKREMPSYDELLRALERLGFRDMRVEMNPNTAKASHLSEDLVKTIHSSYGHGGGGKILHSLYERGGCCPTHGQLEKPRAETKSKAMISPQAKVSTASPKPKKNGTAPQKKPDNILETSSPAVSKASETKSDIKTSRTVDKPDRITQMVRDSINNYMVFSNAFPCEYVVVPEKNSAV